MVTMEAVATAAGTEAVQRGVATVAAAMVVAMVEEAMGLELQVVEMVAAVRVVATEGAAVA